MITPLRSRLHLPRAIARSIRTDASATETKRWIRSWVNDSRGARRLRSTVVQSQGIGSASAAVVGTRHWPTDVVLAGGRSAGYVPTRRLRAPLGN